MSYLSLLPEIGVASFGAVRPLAGLASEGAARFADLLDGARKSTSEEQAEPTSHELPFSSVSLQQRFAEQIAQGSLDPREVARALGDNLTDGIVRLADIAEWTEQRVTALHDRISQSLQTAGVELTEPVELSIRPVDGSIEIQGDHPQRLEIEQTLANDSQLGRDIHQAIAAMQLLHAANNHREFAAEYEQDPQRAVANHRSLFQVPDGTSDRLIMDEFRIRLVR